MRRTTTRKSRKVSRGVTRERASKIYAAVRHDPEAMEMANDLLAFLSERAARVRPAD